jgi:hypothetical protein
MSKPTPNQPQIPERTCQPDAGWRAASSTHYALFAETRGAIAVPGEIWTIIAKDATAEDELLLAVITGPPQDDAAAIVPLASETRYATEWDLTIPSAVLGYQAIAQVKLAGTVTPAQLDQRLSSLPAHLMEELKQLAYAAEQGASIPPAHLPVGPWVLSEIDERLQVRKAAAQALVPYLEPAYEDPSSEWLSFGSILLRHARAIGVELDSLIDPHWARKISLDELDLFEHIPARRLAALLQKLQIKWSERIRDGLYKLVLDRCNPVELVQGSALGRRRGQRTKRARRTKAYLESRERAAGDYVAAVEKALEAKL